MKMSNKKMLKELIKIAVSHGWYSGLGDLTGVTDRGASRVAVFFEGGSHWAETIIFSQNFARAVFGEETDLDFSVIESASVEGNGGEVFWSEDIITDWQYHLMQLAITPEIDRIEYAYKNRRKD